MTTVSLSSHEVRILLDDLCVRLGFCLPPAERMRLCEAPPADTRSFTDAVFHAEGLDPATADLHLYRQVRARVARAFFESAGERDQ